MPDLHLALTPYDIEGLIFFIVFMLAVWCATEGSTHHGR